MIMHVAVQWCICLRKDCEKKRMSQEWFDVASETNALMQWIKAAA